MRISLILVLLCAPGPALAEALLAAHTLRAQTLLTAQDLVVADREIAGALERLEDVVGQETREIIYAGRPILRSQIGRPALITRNQIVALVYETPAMRIVTEGRALGRAGLGERVRVMNTGSRTTVSGLVESDGSVVVKAHGG